MTNFTFYETPVLTLVCIPSGAPRLFSLKASADLTGVHPEMLRYYCRAGLIGHVQGLFEDEVLFDEETLHEIRRIEHYRRHLGVGRRALPLICELRREVERQHVELQFLECP